MNIGKFIGIVLFILRNRNIKKLKYNKKFVIKRTKLKQRRKNYWKLTSNWRILLNGNEKEYEKCTGELRYKKKIKGKREEIKVRQWKKGKEEIRERRKDEIKERRKEERKKNNFHSIPTRPSLPSSPPSARRPSSIYPRWRVSKVFKSDLFCFVFPKTPRVLPAASIQCFYTNCCT